MEVKSELDLLQEDCCYQFYEGLSTQMKSLLLNHTLSSDFDSLLEQVRVLGNRLEEHLRATKPSLGMLMPPNPRPRGSPSQRPNHPRTLMQPSPMPRLAQ